MTLPKAFCVSAQEASTATLSEISKRHDQVFLPPMKEAHYFENAPNFQKGPGWYAAHFAEATPGQLAMNFTPECLPSDVYAKRITEPCGDACKIIIPLRHPVDGAFSQHNFYRRRDIEKALTFDRPI